MNRNRAFTLIELLVVIAIIAILAAILFPVFAQAKLAAKKTVALSNAKQIATANFIYMGDYDDALIKEFYGFPADCSSWGSTYYSWRYSLQPYVAKSNGLLADPTNQFQDKQYWQQAYTDGGATPDINLPSNFAVNNDVIGFANGKCAGPWTPEGQSTLDSLPEPASTILILPSRARWNDLKPSFLSAAWEPQNANDPNNSWCIIPVGGSSNACPAPTDGPVHAVGKQVSWVWSDGHAKAKPPLATLDPSNPNRDDWATQLAWNPHTGQNWTQADRQYVVSTAYPEYK